MSPPPSAADPRSAILPASVATQYGSEVVLHDFDLDAFCREVQNVVKPSREVQAGLPPLRLRIADGPRMVVDGKDKFVLLFAPGFWGKQTEKFLQNAIDILTLTSPLKEDAASKDADKRVGSEPERQGSACYWGLHHHGIAQQFVCPSVATLFYSPDRRLSLPTQKHPLRPSPSLRTYKGKKGAEARRDFLESEVPNEHKVNHLVSVVSPQLYDALDKAKTAVAERSEEGRSWVESWPSVFPNHGIMENRQTALHRDGNGAHYCADFLSLLGDFQGGDLVLPELNLSLEWLPNTACMFDGRTFSHEVEPWTGVRRICTVRYLWKTSLRDLGVSPPTSAPTIAGIRGRVREGKGVLAYSHLQRST
ncbi:hypothetical protein FS749_009276 [Ceratobasidium sp. UAMH 11750]|nr:hypothetical protein FS749_009276 [Ceratobasidium sp. UAMH 11750]